MKLLNNRQSLRAPSPSLRAPSLSLRGLPSCHSERAFHYCHSEGTTLCHSEGAQRPKNLTVSQGKSPEEESLQILRFAQNDIRLLLDTLGEGGEG